MTKMNLLAYSQHSLAQSLMIISFSFILLLLLSQTTEAKKAKPKSVVTYSSKPVCRHVINDFGWHTCRTNDCLDQDYNDWSIWKQLQQKCTLQCRSGSFGDNCEYGDVYPVGRSGIQIGFQCQCSGRSSDAICAEHRSKIGDIVQGIRGRTKTMFKRSRRACKSFCSSLRPGSINNDHCANYYLTPYDLVESGSTASPKLATSAAKSANKRKKKAKKAKKAKKGRAPTYNNWTCVCIGDRTSEDGHDYEGPEAGY